MSEELKPVEQTNADFTDQLTTNVKSMFKSKTFWANIIALLSVIVQAMFGFVVDPAMQVSILALVNILLRKVTNTEVVW